MKHSFVQARQSKAFFTNIIYAPSATWNHITGQTTYVMLKALKGRNIIAWSNALGTFFGNYNQKLRLYGKFCNLLFRLLLAYGFQNA